MKGVELNEDITTEMWKKWQKKQQQKTPKWH